MFKVTRRMPDGTFKTVALYATEELARRHIARSQELHPDRRYGLVWPDNFLHTFDRKPDAT